MAEAREQKQAQPAAATTEKASEFKDLLAKAVGARTDPAKEKVDQMLSALATQALSNTTVVSDETVETIEALIAAIDEKLSKQINLILHHEDFKALEGTWRGLEFLVHHTESDETMKVKVLNISKKDLARTLRQYKGTAFDQGPLFKKIYESEYGQAGGEPFGCLIGDYYFDHTPPDVELLGGMAQIAAASHAPFISAAGSSLMNMETWQELMNPRDLSAMFQSKEYASWRGLRASEDSKYIGLALPRFLARLPYGAKTNPVEEFAFEEDVEGADHSKYVWANAAYAMGVNINRAFKEYGWCSRIRGAESGGDVQGLNCHTFPTDDGKVDMKCPTEIAITDRRENELAKNGLMPLVHYKNTDFAVFIGAESLHKADEYDDADASRNAKLGARLPYMFAMCRFAHYLKCMVRDKIGSFKERDDMEQFLNNWIMNYVEANPNASEEARAKHPLAAAEVKVEEVEGNPGFYAAKFFLRPHYQLEGLTVSLRLVSKLPSAKQEK